LSEDISIRRLYYYVVYFLSVVSLLITCSWAAQAQDSAPPTPDGLIPFKSQLEVQIGIISLVFGLIVMLMQAVSLKQARASQETVMITFVVTLIVVSSLFIASIGWNDRQTAPIFSLYSGILGYLLGKREGKQQSKEEEKDHG
jgi:hypothetical protein